MSRKFPVAVWQDAEGSYTGCILDGHRAAAIDVNVANVLDQLKKFLRWSARESGIGESDLSDLELRDLRVPVRPTYIEDGATFPVSIQYPMRVTCVHGRRKDGTRHCVVPTLDIHLSCQPGDPIDELLSEAIQRALMDKTPQQLSRELMPPAMSLHTIHIGDRHARGRTADERFPALEAVAEPVGRKDRRVPATRAILREAEVRSLADRLQRDKTSLLLLGESGVGKSTELGEAIRQAVRAKELTDDVDREPARNVRRRFWRTNGQRLIAGMQYLGQWEERVEQVIEELAETTGVLWIEDLLELVRVGGREPGGSIAAFLMPYLERGELRIVAETTPSQLDACRRLLPGLAELFEVVRIAEFSPAQARELLATLFAEAARNHKLEIEAGLADLIFRLFKRFEPYAAFPGRTVAFVRHLLDDLTRRERRHVTQADVLDRFQRETGLPQRLLRDDLVLPYDEVLAEFRGAVLGQDAACEKAAGVVMALKTGLNDPRRPLGVLLFCGPTGVGKTEMAKTLAKNLFGAGAVKDRLVRLDMSEYAGPGAVHRLMMSADGEVSPFIKRVRRQPFVLVLLDEIEKAAGEVHDALLGMLDEGRLTDRFGRTTAFQSAVIVMTSNLGAERLMPVGFDGAAQPPFERIAMQAFRPEFFNRIDAVVTFQPLPREVIAALARRELTAIARRDGLVKRNVQLTWSEGVVGRLVDVGCDIRFGARPLLRAVERLVVAPISRWLLENPSIRGRTLTLDFDAAGQIVIGGTNPR